MNTSLTANPAANSLDALAAPFEPILDGLGRCYETLLSVTAAHREAIRRANRGEIQACLDEHQRLLLEIAGLERRRQQAVGAALAYISIPNLGRAVTVSDIAAHVREPGRSRILSRCEGLRGLMLRYREESATIASAAQSLAAHMEGLMRQIGRRLSHSGTYSRRGYVEPGGVVVSALDLRT